MASAKKSRKGLNKSYVGKEVAHCRLNVLNLSYSMFWTFIGHPICMIWDCHVTHISNQYYIKEWNVKSINFYKTKAIYTE